MWTTSLTPRQIQIADSLARRIANGRLSLQICFETGTSSPVHSIHRFIRLEYTFPVSSVQVVPLTFRGLGSNGRIVVKTDKCLASAEFRNYHPQDSEFGFVDI